MTITRRTLLKLAGLAPAAKIAGIQIAAAEDREFRHALTLFEDIKYPADFKHFDYVNPAAPKGGRVRFDFTRRCKPLGPLERLDTTETPTSTSKTKPLTHLMRGDL